MKKDLLEIVQGNIKYLRNQRGWSQENLAEKAGLSMIFIAEIESKRKSPSLDSLQKISQALGINGYELMIEDLPHFLPENITRNELIDSILATISKFKK